MRAESLCACKKEHVMNKFTSQVAENVVREQREREFFCLFNCDDLQHAADEIYWSASDPEFTDSEGYVFKAVRQWRRLN